MAPPPRPPIICYDLQTNSNARRVPDARYRVPLTVTARKSKVTVLQRDANELKNARADACWHQQNSYNVHGRYEHYAENLPSCQRPKTTTTTTRPIERTKAPSLPTHDKIVRINRPQYSKNLLLESKPYKFNTQPFANTTNNQCSTMSSKLNVANSRHAYGQKLRHDMEERECRLERKRKHLAMQAQLDEITTQLESFKGVYENMLNSFGMGHNTAKYFQKQEEEVAKLRMKVDQFAETRSRELGRRVQQMKRIQEIQRKEDKRVEEMRLRENHRPITPLSTHCKRRWDSTLNNSLSSNSPTTNTTTTNTASPSSTISISSCSSPMSIDDQHIHSIHFEDPPTYKSTTKTTLPPSSTILSSSAHSKSPRYNKKAATAPTPARPNNHFSFYKGDPNERNETIEVTDVDFFDKVEDKTMLEVNELMEKMQSVLRNVGQELQ